MKSLYLAVLCALVAPAHADSLTDARMATIKAAYAEATPPMTERLPEYRLKAMHSAFATHDSSPETEALSPQRFAMMRSAYDSHDVLTGFRMASN